MYFCKEYSATELDRRRRLARYLNEPHLPLITEVRVIRRLNVCVLSRVQLFATPWTVAQQAPLSMEFSRQEYWSGLTRPPSRDLPNPGIEPRSPTLQADSLPSEPPGKPKKHLNR